MRWQTRPPRYEDILLRVITCTRISQQQYDHVDGRLYNLHIRLCPTKLIRYRRVKMSSLDPSERRSEAAQRTVANSPRRAYYDLTRSTMEHYPPPNEPVMDPQITGGIADSGISGPLYSHGAEPVPPQSDVDDFLRKKRKAREHKACYPCRQRKVRYDKCCGGCAIEIIII